MNSQKQNIIVFDVDGVLLNNKSGGFKEILSEYFNKQKEVNDINEEYQRRKHLGPWGLEQLTELATKFIAFNTGKEEVISKADYIIQKKDLTKILELNI